MPGSRSASGKPLLANDAHVDFSAPAVFYLAHLRAGRFELSGATWPGLPVFFVGTNKTIAWGQVALHASVSDLFEETLDPAEPRRYERAGRWRKANAAPRGDRGARRRAGADRGRAHRARAAPAQRAPRRLARERARAALDRLRRSRAASTARCGCSAAATGSCFRGALRELPAPAATFLYADAAGAIGTQVAGELPIRSIDTGLLPVSGASRFYDWKGSIPFDELPSAFGPNLPPQVVSSHPDGDAFRHPVSWLWSSEGGAERVRELVAQDDTDRRRGAGRDPARHHLESRPGEPEALDRAT